MFEGAVCPVVTETKPKEEKKFKFKVVIKTAYATIEQMFYERSAALDFILTSKKTMDVKVVDFRPVG